VLAGCVTNHQRYGWGTYDPSLYAYYKDPTKEAALAESLAAIISTQIRTTHRFLLASTPSMGTFSYKRGRTLLRLSFSNRKRHIGQNQKCYGSHDKGCFDTNLNELHKMNRFAKYF